MKKTIILMITAVIAAGCCRYDVDEILLMRTDISLTWKGDLQMSYDPLRCQLSHDRSDNIFRVYDDALANWFVLDCSVMPSYEGQELTADVIWTTADDTREERGLTFVVEKTDDSGQIWMWNKSKRIGIVIKNL